MIQEYIDHGWKLCPIPHGQKGPVTPDWNRVENALPASFLATGNIGLMHGFSGTCAFDIDDINGASDCLLQQGIDLEALLSAQDAVQIRSGRANRAKLLFIMPFGSVLPTKCVLAEDGHMLYELRCGTQDPERSMQDVLPPSLHPEGHVYSWIGDWRRLPMLPGQLLTHWQSLLTQKAPPVPDWLSPLKKLHHGYLVEINWAQLQCATNTLSSDCDRDEWLRIGMALHDYTTKHDILAEGYEFWVAWSKTCPERFDLNACRATWKSFEADSGITAGSIVALAITKGWRLPPEDVSVLFTKIEPKTPEAVTDDIRPAPPAFDTSWLSPVLRQRAEELAEHRGCDPIVPAYAGLAAVCAAADSRIRLELANDYKVAPILWLMSVGSPSDKKTPGSVPMLEPLSVLEREDRPRHHQNILAWEAQEAFYLASKKDMLSALKSNPLDNDVPMIGGELPPRPAALRYTVQDVNSQKLVRLLAERPYGMLAYQDELGSWIKKINDPRSGEDRGCWIQGYEGGRYIMDRVGTGTQEVDCMGVSIYGNIQPKVLRSEIPKMETDGLLQRFIPGILRPEYTRMGNPPESDLYTNKSEWICVLRKIASLPVCTYQLDPQAKLLFREFQHWFEQTRQDNRVLNSNDLFLTSFSKLESTVGRVALVLHLMESPNNQHVTVDVLARAIRFIRDYVHPAQRYMYQEMSGKEQGIESWCVDYVIQHASVSDTFTLSEVRRSGRAQIPDGMNRYAVDQLFCDALQELERAGWLKQIGSDKFPAWSINPKLSELFEGKQKAVILAKQRQRDEAVLIARRSSGKHVERRFAKGYRVEWDSLIGWRGE